jgi:uncharacterized protein (DUF3084 family)
LDREIEILQLKMALYQTQAQLLQLQLNIVGDQYRKAEAELEALQEEPSGE